jgi:hypothetical protein
VIRVPPAKSWFPLALLAVLAAALVGATDAAADPLMAPSRTCGNPAATSLPLGKVVATSAIMRRRSAASRSLHAMVCFHDYAHVRLHMPRFRVSRKLGAAAALKARKMVACNEFSHTPCGINTATYEWLVHFTGTWWGENAAYLSDSGGYSSARATFNAWLNSQEHRFSIAFRHYNEIGIAAVHLRSLGNYGIPGVLWVVDFGSST